MSGILGFVAKLNHAVDSEKAEVTKKSCKKEKEKNIGQNIQAITIFFFANVSGPLIKVANS